MGLPTFISLSVKRQAWFKVESLKSANSIPAIPILRHLFSMSLIS
ncbi:unnamed protein product [Schistosoma curassoni]|uniref:Uncharacterized protein n=1 Tax=Schistosoma curassoni TaxID=6186 RepID=A0A183JF83_9TREM|nr:unnamed protein product [Schistosoma curassoni]